MWIGYKLDKFGATCSPHYLTCFAVLWCFIIVFALLASFVVSCLSCLVCWLLGNWKFDFGFRSLSATTTKQIWCCQNYPKFVTFGTSTWKAVLQEGIRGKQETWAGEFTGIRLPRWKSMKFLSLIFLTGMFLKYTDFVKKTMWITCPDCAVSSEKGLLIHVNQLNLCIWLMT